MPVRLLVLSLLVRTVLLLSLPVYAQKVVEAVFEQREAAAIASVESQQ